MIYHVNEDFRKDYDGDTIAFYWYQKEFLKAFAKHKKMTYLLPRQHGKTELGIRILIDFMFKFHKRKNPEAIVTMRTIEQCHKYYVKGFEKQMGKLPPSVLTKSGSKASSIVYKLYRPQYGDWASVTFSGVENPDSLRGGTFDFVLADEAAFYKPKVISGVLDHFLNHTDGKLLLTSTANGPTGEFYNRVQTYKKKSADPNSPLYHFERDVRECRMWSEKRIADKLAEAKEEGATHVARRELFNDFWASATGEMPFAPHISDAVSNSTRFFKDFDDEESAFLEESELNVNVDIGKYENMATFFWRRLGRKVEVVAYEDKFDGLPELIDYTFKKFNQDYNKINIIFPSDAANPAMVDKGTIHDSMQRYIHTQGYNRVIELKALTQVKNKEAFWAQGLSRFKHFHWERDKTAEAFNKLGTLRFKIDPKTEYVHFGKVPENEHSRHCADAYLYMVESAFYGAEPKSYGAPPKKMKRTAKANFKYNRRQSGYNKNGGRFYKKNIRRT